MKEIPLTKGFKAIVDDEDYEYLTQWKWRASPSGKLIYAIRTIKINGHNKNVLMHRDVIKCPAGMFTDHINRNTLDNRKANLRVCSRLQNNVNTVHKRNKSGYIGVYISGKKWRVKVTHNKKVIGFGTFDNPIDAARVYDDIVRKLHGEFAVTNF